MKSGAPSGFLCSGAPDSFLFSMLTANSDYLGRLLSKEGQARSAGVVCSKSRSILIDGREALLIKSVRFAAICKERATREHL